MKRGKDEKIMGPMFPRLHVNDAEKGGSRAPPRNKMALYEQLSIPSQRVSHVTHVVLPCNRNNNVTDSVPPLSQGGGNEWGVFFPWQAHPRHPSEKQFSPYSEQSTPLAQVEKKKKLDEDDDKVPIFIHSVPKEFYIYRNDLNLEKLSSSDPPYLPPLSNFQKAKEIGVLENNMKQEGKEKKEENPNELVAGWKQTVPLLSHEPGDDVANSIETDKSGLLELCDESEDSQLFGNTAEKNYSNSQEALPSEDQNIDLSNETVSCEDGSCRLLQPGNLERGDSVSESYILDTVSVPDITPDDVVGIIGRKHFWKARRAIVKIIIPHRGYLFLQPPFMYSDSA